MCEWFLLILYHYMLCRTSVLHLRYCVFRSCQVTCRAGQFGQLGFMEPATTILRFMHALAPTAAFLYLLPPVLTAGDAPPTIEIALPTLAADERAKLKQ